MFLKHKKLKVNINRELNYFHSKNKPNIAEDKMCLNTIWTFVPQVPTTTF